MKKIKHILLMLLMFTIMCGNLSSCDSDNQTVVWKVYDSASIFTETWEEALNELLSKKGVEYTVKIEAYGDSIYNEVRDDIPIDLLKEMKENDEHVDVITTTPSGGYQLRGSLDDFGNIEYLATYEDAVSMGLLISLDEYLESDEGLALKEAIMPENLERTRIYGEVYGISQWMRTISAMGYNKDLLEKYDIDVSELSPNVFENENILRTVWEGERVSGEAFAAYIGQIGESRLGLWTIEQSDVVAFDADREKFINVYESEEFKTYVNNLYALKNEGILSYKYSGFDDFFAVSTTAKNNEIYEEKYSFRDTKGNNVEKELVVIPDVKQPIVNLYDMDSVTGIASWSEDYDVAFDFIIRLFTDPDIANLIQYGIEDENYVLENGKVIRKTHTKILEDGTEITTVGNEWLVASHFTNNLITYSEPYMAVDKYAYMETYFENEPDGLPVGFRFDAESVGDELEVIYNLRLYDIPDTPLYKFEADDIDAALDEIYQLLENAGIDKVLEEIQRQYDEWKAEQE